MHRVKGVVGEEIGEELRVGDEVRGANTDAMAMCIEWELFSQRHVLRSHAIP